LIAFSAMSCSLLGGNQEMGVITHEIELPEGNYSGLVWLKEDMLVFTGYLPDLPNGNGDTDSDRIWQINSNGSAMEMVNIISPHNCRRYQLIPEFRLPDGRLGYKEDCFPEEITAPTSYYLIYDLDTGAVEALVSKGVVNTGGLVWNPDLDRFITTDYSEGIVRGRLAWITPDGLADIPDLPTVSRAASWSPDNTWIAFAGSEQAGEFPYDIPDTYLYLMSPDTPHNPRMVWEANIQNTTWTPDSEWIIALAKFEGTKGIWAFNVETEQANLIYEGRFPEAAISPDGTQMAAILKSYDQNGELYRNDRILFFDLAAILKSIEEESTASQ
jgi:hypothetical protein